MPDPPADTNPSAKKSKSHKSQLRVVFDTNALYVTPTSLGSASDLVRDEIAGLISESKYPDLDILWFLPEVVRHERQYQMETEALKLRSSINKIERLLGHNLALTDKSLVDHVKTKIDEKENELGLQEIKLNHGSVDWQSLIHAAVYRKPPFQVGEKEKGFRDALVLESFLQLVNESPRTASSCRVVLVTSDELLKRAVEVRIGGLSNASVLAGVEELKGLINTLISSVSEDFIAQVNPKAAKLFFVSAADKETLYYREKIGDQIAENFKKQLERLPEGTSFRRNVAWYIGRPNFSKKEVKRIFWTSRIEIEFEAGSRVKESEARNILQGVTTPAISSTSAPQLGLTNLSALAGVNSASIDWNNWANYLIPAPAEKEIVTHKGRDIFEVLWSVELTMNKELKKAQIHDIRHVELRSQPVS